MQRVQQHTAAETVTAWEALRCACAKELLQEAVPWQRVEEEQVASCSCKAQPVGHSAGTCSICQCHRPEHMKCKPARAFQTGVNAWVKDHARQLPDLARKQVFACSGLAWTQARLHGQALTLPPWPGIDLCPRNTQKMFQLPPQLQGTADMSEVLPATLCTISQHKPRMLSEPMSRHGGC